MQRLITSVFATVLWFLSVSMAAQMKLPAPSAEISNGILRAKLYLPDPQKGYYRGSRFDWSGVISRLDFKGHNYFGVWFPDYDPRLHDAITGPVEEFRSGSTGLGSGVGYDEARPGGFFLKVGVGVLKKPDDKPYTFVRSYDIVNSGMWTSRPGRDRVEFQQDLKDDSGYSYSYKKIVRLAPHKPELILEHSLRNNGKKLIETDVYDHDFYVLDAQPTGPGTRIIFAFKPEPTQEAGWSGPQLDGKAEVHGNEIDYVRELRDGHDTASSLLKGFSDNAKDNDIRVENARAGIGVREVGDQPMVRLNLWSIRTTVCPEAYIHLRVAPGEEKRWKIRYIFYELKK